MANAITSTQQRRLMRLLNLRDQVYALEDAWTQHIREIEAHELQQEEVPPITRFMPLRESLSTLRAQIQFYNSRIRALRRQNIFGTAMYFVLEEELAEHLGDARQSRPLLGRTKVALPKIQANLQEITVDVKATEMRHTEAIERLRYFADTCIEIEEGAGLEASAALHVFRRARAMGLRV